MEIWTGLIYCLVASSVTLFPNSVILLCDFFLTGYSVGYVLHFMKIYSYFLVKQVILMEGLASSRITPICAHSRQQASTFIPTFSLQPRKKFYINQIQMRKHTNGAIQVSASVQPLEASTKGRFENTTPSKGYYLSLQMSFLIFYTFKKLISPSILRHNKGQMGFESHRLI